MAIEDLVSVLVPLYNKEAYVAKTVASALAQTHDNLEVLVLDDGSTDRSLEELRSFDDPRLRVVSRENRGANATRNELLGLANGEYVQFLDADDLIRPTKISEQLSLMSAEVDAVFCRYSVSPCGGTKDPEAHPMFHDNAVRFLADEGIASFVPLYRRASLVRIGGFDESLAASQEYELHLRLALTGEWTRIACVDNDLATWRRVADSISGDDARVYEAKVRALESLFALAERADDRASLSNAMANAGLHLARAGKSAAAAKALQTAWHASPNSFDALPYRKRHLVRFPRLLVQLERAEFRLRGSRIVEIARASLAHVPMLRNIAPQQSRRSAE